MYVTQEFENVTCSAKKGSVILKKKIKEIFPFPDIFHRKKIKIIPKFIHKSQIAREIQTF